MDFFDLLALAVYGGASGGGGSGGGGKTESVSGSTPTIEANDGISYECGEVSTLTIEVPISGCFDVVFESGTTPTVLTLTLPTGHELEWTDDFDDTSLDANAIYEINIRVKGTKCLGVAGKWAST